MALNGNWIDKVDGVDDVLAEDINSIARAVISIEEANGDIDAALDRIIAIQNELLGIITFTVEGTEYTADRGMTWGEWAESEYNTVDIFDSGGGMYTSNLQAIYDEENEWVQGSWEILGNHAYHF